MTQSTIHNSESAIRDDCHEASLRLFVTVGTDLPFDRLVRAVDQWAKENRIEGVFAQIGETSWKPEFIAYEKFLEPPEFKERFTQADLIVSHAGMGTILSSLQYQKPLLVMPRVAALGEHRNEHQLATAKHLQALDKINVASDEKELIKMLENHKNLDTREPIGPHASATLTDALRAFIQAG